MSSVSFSERDFVTNYTPLSLDYRVQKYSWSAIGGPKQATILAKGSDVNLWRLIEMVRSPVIIYADAGDAVWWGYVAKIDMNVRSEVAIRNPSIQQLVKVGVTADTFYNRIAIAYTELNAGDASIGERKTTTWADDTDSQAEYGIRELLWTKDNATAAHAEAARDMKLEQVKYPVPVISHYTEKKTSSANLICRGYWDTLDWRYYSNAGTTEIDTATQIKTIIDAKGEFISGVDKEVTSGITISEYRDGDATALFEIAQMLEMGTTNYRRMLATVTAARRVEITEESFEYYLPYLIGADGSWQDRYGVEVRRETCPVGVWARMKDIMPASVDSAMLADPSLLFVEENEYDVEKKTLTHLARGAPDPWEFPTVKDG